MRKKASLQLQGNLILYQVEEYVRELNSLESRRGRRPLDVNNVIYWFKNTRAAVKRAEMKSRGPNAASMNTSGPSGASSGGTTSSASGLIPTSRDRSSPPPPPPLGRAAASTLWPWFGGGPSGESLTSKQPPGPTPPLHHFYDKSILPGMAGNASSFLNSLRMNNKSSASMFNSLMVGDSKEDGRPNHKDNNNDVMDCSVVTRPSPTKSGSSDLGGEVEVDVEESSENRNEEVIRGRTSPSSSFIKEKGGSRDLSTEGANDAHEEEDGNGAVNDRPPQVRGQDGDEEMVEEDSSGSEAASNHEAMTSPGGLGGLYASSSPTSVGQMYMSHYMNSFLQVSSF